MNLRARQPTFRGTCLVDECPKTLNLQAGATHVEAAIHEELYFNIGTF